MKKRNWIFISALTTGLLLGVGCSDEYLDRQPEGQFSVNDVATPSGVEDVLIGKYHMLPVGGHTGQSWHNELHCLVFNFPSIDGVKDTDFLFPPHLSYIE